MYNHLSVHILNSIEDLNSGKLTLKDLEKNNKLLYDDVINYSYNKSIVFENYLVDFENKINKLFSNGLIENYLIEFKSKVNRNLFKNKRDYHITMSSQTEIINKLCKKYGREEIEPIYYFPNCPLS